MPRATLASFASLASLASHASVLLLAACGGHRGSPAIGSTSSAPSGPVEPVPAPEPGPAPADSLDHLAADATLDAICFAWSPAGAAMCDVGQDSIQGGATYEVVILGPDPASFTYYQSPEDEQFFDVDPARIDRAALAEAKAAAAAGDFRGWTGGPSVDVAVGATAMIGGHRLRRTRVETGSDGDPETGVWSVSKDTVELRCGDRWVPLALDGDVFANSIGEPTIAVVQLGAELLFTGRVSWGMEGDHGGGTDAALIDPAEACRR